MPSCHMHTATGLHVAAESAGQGAPYVALPYRRMRGCALCNAPAAGQIYFEQRHTCIWAPACTAHNWLCCSTAVRAIRVISVKQIQLAERLGRRLGHRSSLVPAQGGHPSRRRPWRIRSWNAAVMAAAPACSKSVGCRRHGRRRRHDRDRSCRPSLGGIPPSGVTWPARLWLCCSSRWFCASR